MPLSHGNTLMPICELLISPSKIVPRGRRCGRAVWACEFVRVDGTRSILVLLRICLQRDWKFSGLNYSKPQLDLGLCLLAHGTSFVTRGFCVFKCVIVQTDLWVGLFKPGLDPLKRE